MNDDSPPLGGVTAFVMAGGVGDRLRPLTRRTPKPLLPFGGGVRLLDLTLSNCANSGVPVVGVLSQYKSEQFSAHLRRLWSAKSPGCTVFHLPPPRGRQNRGNADAVRQHMDFALKRGARDVLILSADHVYSADYRQFVGFHRTRGADFTVAVVRVPRHTASQFGVLQCDQNAAVTGYEEKPQNPRPSADGNPDVLVNMGVYVSKTELLLETLGDSDSRLTDFGRDVVPYLLGRCDMAAWEFHSAGGEGCYWRDVGTLDAYYEAHLDLLNHRFCTELFPSKWPIDAAERCGASPLCDSIVAGGCRIDGQISHSVLSPGAWVAKNARVYESLLLQNVRVAPGARLHRVIVGPGVHIPKGTFIGFDAVADRLRFHVTAGGVVVVDRPGRSVSDEINQPYRVPAPPAEYKSARHHSAGTTA